MGDDIFYNPVELIIKNIPAYVKNIGLEGKNISIVDKKINDESELKKAAVTLYNQNKSIKFIIDDKLLIVALHEEDSGNKTKILNLLEELDENKDTVLLYDQTPSQTILKILKKAAADYNERKLMFIHRPKYYLQINATAHFSSPLKVYVLTKEERKKIMEFGYIPENMCSISRNDPVSFWYNLEKGDIAALESYSQNSLISVEYVHVV